MIWSSYEYVHWPKENTYFFLRGSTVCPTWLCRLINNSCQSAIESLVRSQNSVAVAITFLWKNAVEEFKSLYFPSIFHCVSGYSTDLKHNDYEYVHWPKKKYICFLRGSTACPTWLCRLINDSCQLAVDIWRRPRDTDLSQHGNTGCGVFKRGVQN